MPVTGTMIQYAHSGHTYWGYMHKISRFNFLFPLLMLLLATQAQAFTFKLSQKDLNQVVGMTFPQTQYYEGMKVVFSDPYLTLSANNKVAVDVNILGSRDGQQMEARATLSGQLRYDGNNGELQIERPMLNDFKVLNSTLQNEKDIVRWAEQLKGQSAPIILLVNFKDLNLSFLGSKLPSDMRVEAGQLVVEF